MAMHSCTTSYIVDALKREREVLTVISLIQSSVVLGSVSRRKLWPNDSVVLYTEVVVWKLYFVRLDEK